MKVRLALVAIGVLFFQSGCGMIGSEGSIRFDRGWLSQLVVPSPGGFVRFNPQQLASADYVLFYYGANWCGPCHQLVPQVIATTNQLKSAHPNFAVIFISRDRSETEMLRYMTSTKMPWPAVRFEALDRISDIISAGGRSIPALVLVDRDGRILTSSSRGGRYVGADPVLRELEQRLRQGRETAALPSPKPDIH